MAVVLSRRISSPAAVLAVRWKPNVTPRQDDGIAEGRGRSSSSGASQGVALWLRELPARAMNHTLGTHFQCSRDGLLTRHEHKRW